MSRMALTGAICGIAVALHLLGVPGLSVDWTLGMVAGVWLTWIAGYEPT